MTINTCEAVDYDEYRKDNNFDCLRAEDFKV